MFWLGSKAKGQLWEEGSLLVLFLLGAIQIAGQGCSARAHTLHQEIQGNLSGLVKTPRCAGTRRTLRFPAAALGQPSRSSECGWHGDPCRRDTGRAAVTPALQPPLPRERSSPGLSPVGPLRSQGDSSDPYGTCFEIRKVPYLLICLHLHYRYLSDQVKPTADGLK